MRGNGVSCTVVLRAASHPPTHPHADPLSSRCPYLCCSPHLLWRLGCRVAKQVRLLQGPAGFDDLARLCVALT